MIPLQYLQNVRKQDIWFLVVISVIADHLHLVGGMRTNQCAPIRSIVTVSMVMTLLFWEFHNKQSCTKILDKDHSFLKREDPEYQSAVLAETGCSPIES